MTTIPLKDGAPDWSRRNWDQFLTPEELDFCRKGYIAALERCAKWHEGQIQTSVHPSSGYVGPYTVQDYAHRESAKTIRYWIEKEKKG